jgi:PTS system nitrogen regulatory IIA component
MKLLSRILPAGNIVLDLPASSKKRAFEQAGLLFENNNGLERAAVFERLFAREKLGSTGLGEGVAVPHGRVKGLSQSVAAYIRLDRPVPFDAIDGQPVKQLLFLLAPESEAQQHLDILAEVAQLLSDNALRARLLIETDPLIVHQLLTGLAS